MSDLSLDQWMQDLQSEQPFLDESMLISLVEKRVEQLIADNPDLLFSYLYRLDVDEYKIQSALHLGKDIAHTLSVLIVRRQKARLDTKTKYRQEQKESDTSSFDPVDY